MMNVKFGQRLKELRVENRLTRKDIANLMHVSVPTVYRWETGEMEPGYLALIILANYFKVSTDYLLGVED